ncbi:MAG: GNAT family N-acetyltransferase [Dehalococcoidia bacterium]|nr:GNAT family N-acetyltransferase [Dehalococcoidia bacterium]
MKNRDLTIRNACSNELDEVSILLKDAYQQYENFWPEAWVSYLEDIMNVRSRLGDSDLIVAELDNRIAGCITLYLNGSRSFPEAWPKGWAVVRLLAVHPEYWGQRIGHALMEECIHRCRQASIAAIGLHTAEVMDIARQMYERMGFVRLPESDFHPAPGITVMAYRLQL